MNEEKPKKKRGPINPHKGTRDATMEKYKLFAQKYVETNNGGFSAKFAGYSPKSCYQTGNRLLKIKEVQELIADYREQLALNTGITTEAVLKRYWELANVDVNDIVQYKRYACRHCYGVDNAYQWVDENEYWLAYAHAAAKDDGKLPDDAGGYGYTRHNVPNPECPACDGIGDGAMVINDTTTLSGSSRVLYDGIKQTQHGIEVKLRDRDKHLDAVARILGMFKDNLTVNNVTDDGTDEW